MNKNTKILASVICALLALYIVSVTYYLADLYTRVAGLEHTVYHLVTGKPCGLQAK